MVASPRFRSRALLRRCAAAAAAVAVLTGCAPLPDTPSAPAATAASAASSTTAPGAATSSTPAPTPPDATAPADPAPHDDGSDAAPGTAAAALAGLAVKGRAPKTGYAREEFGPRWSDTDHNGCDTRNDILRRDLTDITVKAGTHGCNVASGMLLSPYTSTTVDFVAGQLTSSQVQIDHVVALSDAWQKGAQQLAAQRRTELANDPLNLLAVDGPSNNQKSDADAATWLPAAIGFRCEYVAAQIAVKQRYELWVTPPEKSAMQRVLGDCPDQALPAGHAAPDPDPRAPTAGTTPETAPGTRATQPAAPARSAEPGTSAAPAAPEAPAAAPAAPEAPAAPAAPAAGGDVYFARCAEARAAGAAPLYAGQPGYRSGLDRDGDGIACESSR